MASAVQHDAAQILSAQLAAQRLRIRAEHKGGAVLGMSRDELRELACRLEDVAAIAERMHLERAAAGSLSPDAFPEPIV